MTPRPLFPHQQRALDYAAKRSRIALFMEMRLGKSAVAIRWARHHQLDRVLILGPTSVLPGWIDELMVEGVRASDIHFLTGTTLVRRAIAAEIDTGWALANYETVRYQPDILAMAWDGLILDESTRIRNPRAQITKLCLKASSHIVYRAVLSGLPAPESPLDYWCQMAFLHGGFMESYNYWAFRQRYFYPDISGYDWLPKTGVLDALKKEVHRTAFVLTRKAAGMGERKIYEKRIVEMSPSQIREYRTVARDFAFRNLETQWATTQMLWLARLAGGFSPDQTHPEVISDTKLTELVSLLTGELKVEPVVVWFRFNEELHAAKQWLDAARVETRTILGETKVEDRRQHVADFQAGKYRVLLMQLKCGKFGLNVSRASTAIYYSNSYDFEDRAQSEDRIVHPQKHEPLLYVDLITRTTVDHAIVDTLRDKHANSRVFMLQLVTAMKRDYYLNYGKALMKQPVTAAAGEPMTARIKRLFPSDRRARALDRRK